MPHKDEPTNNIALLFRAKESYYVSRIENKMNAYVDFAVCPCGAQSAIQPTKPVIQDENPQPSGSVEGVIVVACTRCKRLYRFDTGSLVSIPTERGLAPYNPDSPIRVFRVPIECDELNCETQIIVFVAASSTTNASRLEEEKMKWSSSGSGLICAGGHEFRWPPYR